MYEEYAIIQSRIDALEEQKKALREKINEDMKTRGIEKEETALGKFSFKNMTSWEYPERIIKAEEDVNAEKAKAQSTGEATATISQVLTFTKVKF